MGLINLGETIMYLRIENEKLRQDTDQFKAENEKLKEEVEHLNKIIRYEEEWKLLESEEKWE